MSTTFVRGENPLRADKLNTAFSERVDRSGDTMTGMLMLAGDPVGNFDAATKQYVDAKVNTVSGGYLPLTGGTVTGATTFGGPVTLPAGTTAARPGAVTAGSIRYNTTEGTFEGANGTRWTPVATRIIQRTSIAELRSLDMTAYATGSVVAFVASYTNSGDMGGGWYDWSATSLRTDEAVMVIRPTNIAAGNPGRWLRRWDAQGVSVEACGAVGDYVFPSGGTGEVTGTDNTNALTTAANIVSIVASSGSRGGTVRLGPRAYRITGNFSVPPGVKIEGVGGMASGGVGDARFDAGSIIVCDGPNAFVTLDAGAWIEGVKIMYRGMDKAPGSASVNAYWASRLSDLCAARQWVAATAYSVGDIRVNLNNVYRCDTAGTSGAVNTGGPLSQGTAASSVTDGTAAWHFIGEYTWARARAYVTGMLVVNFHRVYQCTTGGTSASTGNGPTGAGTGVADGTCVWNWLGDVPTAIRPISYCRVTNCAIVGFSRGIVIKEGLAALNLVIDALHGIDIQQSGDVVVMDNVRLRQLYHVSGATQRRHGVGIFAHDRVDTLQLRSCGAQFWAIGFCLSNVWPMVSDCCVESDTTTRGDACIQLRNVTQGGLFENNYLAGTIAFDIQSISLAKAPWPGPAGTAGASAINISGGWYGTHNNPTYTGAVDASYTPTCFRITGLARAQVSGIMINRQGRVPFQFLAVSPAPSLGEMLWLLDNIRVDEQFGATFNLADLAVIDSSVAAYVNFSHVWHSELNRLVVGDVLTAVDPVDTTRSANIRAGAGAATGTQPKGSLWLRTDGAVGSTLYVSQGGGTWNAVAGV